ncbi:hypothetical protein IW150_001424 [Coemansia sp. RSA 2607]|nr:hypothetical protein IW150_001424 [Coemansia sp. RSA 2607]
MLASSAIADSHLSTCALKRLVAIPAVHSRHASVLARHTVHANTRLPSFSPLTAQQTTPVHHGYPIHLSHNAPSFIDPLQFILKDVITPPLAPLNAPTHLTVHETQRLLDRVQTAAGKTANTPSSLSPPKAPKWHHAAAVLASNNATISSSGNVTSRASRTIELDVTPDQLRSLLMMRSQETSASCATSSSTVSAHPALLLSHSNASSGGSPAVSVTAKSDGSSCHVLSDSLVEPHISRHASTCAVDFTWSHEIPSGSGPGSNTATTASAAATVAAIVGVSALLGLESSDIAAVNRIPSTDVSNILCCSQL